MQRIEAQRKSGREKARIMMNSTNPPDRPTAPTTWLKKDQHAPVPTAGWQHQKTQKQSNHCMVQND